MIKNIIYDIDGVLVDMDHARWLWLREFPQYRNLKKADMVKLFPLDPNDGCIASSNTPVANSLPHKLGESKHDFNRPPLPGVMEAVKKFNKSGYRQFTMTATKKPNEKRVWFNGLFGNLIEFVPTAKLSNNYKHDDLVALMKKEKMKPEETVYLEDRFYIIRDALAIPGLRVVRMRPKLSLPLPKDLRAAVPEFTKFSDFAKWLATQN
ncbi:MAG: HAD family hydrolase [Alphaproteobacteria bacterium]|nr:HAD family hydrolase [Alphaproteobacteria bacterium]